MARRRQLGNALQASGQDLLNFALQRMGAQQQNQMVSERQQELARLNQQLEIQKADLARKQQDRQQVLQDPSGRTAQMLANAGESEYARFVPGPGQAIANVGAEQAKAVKPEELRTDLDFEPMLASQPGGQMAAKDPTAIETLMAQRNAQRAKFAGIEERNVDLAGQTAEAQGRGQAMGKESADALNAPAQMQRRVAEEKALNPVLIGRAGGIAGVQQAAETAGEAARIRQAQELAARDPAIAATAEAVLKDPALLDKVTSPRERKYVIQAMGSSQFQGQAVKNSIQMQQTALQAVRQLLAHPGREGLTGLRINDPTRWTWSGEPIQGTNTADAKALFDQFRSAVSLPNLRYMQGLGHMSDREFASVAAASTAADTKMSEPGFQRELQAVERSLVEALARNGVTEGTTAPGAAATPVDPRQSAFEKLQRR